MNLTKTSSFNFSYEKIIIYIYLLLDLFFQTISAKPNAKHTLNKSSQYITLGWTSKV